MSYVDFKNISDVCEEFDFDYEKKEFISEEKVELNKALVDMIEENLKDNMSFLNEYVICEEVIKPIINIVAKKHDLPVWSHVPFEVDKERGLTGTPDYIFALPKRGRMRFKPPIACLGEAKRDDFIQGWGQTSAEMVAAQIANKNTKTPIYGLVTNGKLWEFGKLEGNLFTIEEKGILATDNLQKVLNILNWLFGEAKKNADILLEIEKGEKK